MQIQYIASTYKFVIFRPDSPKQNTEDFHVEYRQADKNPSERLPYELPRSLESQKEVFSYFRSKQILPSGSAELPLTNEISEWCGYHLNHSLPRQPETFLWNPNNKDI